MNVPQLQGLSKDTGLECFGNWGIAERLGLDCSRFTGGTLGEVVVVGFLHGDHLAVL